MPTLSPPPPKERTRIARRQQGAPACLMPGCGRAAPFHGPSVRHPGLDRLGYCSQTCFQNHRWLLTLDKAR